MPSMVLLYHLMGESAVRERKNPTIEYESNEHDLSVRTKQKKSPTKMKGINIICF